MILRTRSTFLALAHPSADLVGATPGVGALRRDHPVLLLERRGVPIVVPDVGTRVLVSQTVKDLVAGSGLTFEGAGEHELNGVPDRWRLYRVAG
jgi:hypothetical protein